MDKLIMDLQLFAEGDPAPAAAPVVDNSVVSPPAPHSVSTATPSEDFVPPVVPGVEGYDPTTATAETRRNIIEGWLKGADTPPEVTPPITEEIPPAPAQSASDEPLISIPDKFKMPDGSVNMDAFVKSYIFAEKKISEQGEEIRTLRTQPPAQGTPLEQSQPEQSSQAPAQLTKEELDKVKEQWFDKFYDNPQEALADLLSGVVEKTVNPLLAPIAPVVQDFSTRQQTALWAKEAEKVAEKYSDFDTFADAMTTIIGSMKPQEFAALPNPMETVYLMAKGSAPVTPTPKLEDSLKDPEFVKSLATNPEIRKAVLTTYANNVNGERKPNVIGAGSGGVPPAAPPQEIRTVNDATRASREFFSKHLTGG